MDDTEKDEVPMLLDTNKSQLLDRYADIELKRFTARSQSASIFITPPDSIESYESRNQFLPHTGSMSSTRRTRTRTPFVPLSGPLYPAGTSENNIWPTLGITSSTTPKPMTLDLPSVDASDKKYLLNDKVSGENEHLARSGLLGICNDPYCTTCPAYNHLKAQQQKNAKSTPRFNSRFQSVFNGDYKAKGWTKRSFSFIHSCIPIMNPHAKVVQRWNQFFVLSCLVAIFIDPTFFLLLSVIKEYKCIVLDWPMATVFAVVRSITDFIYFLHILLQFRLAYVAPESTVVGAGDLVDHPKKIAKHYIRGYFFVDLFVVLPLPQIMILVVVPTSVGSANYARIFLQTIALVQYLPRILRCLPLLVGQSASGFIFETAWANFFINLLIFILSGHVVGSCWYLFGLQRVNHCLRANCGPNYCEFIDCGISSFNGFRNKESWRGWLNDTTADICFNSSSAFDFGIYQQVVKVANNRNVFARYTYSLFWGFQQICTLAGNQVPSTGGPEALFVMGIIGLGLFLFALLIGNMQNFLQALGRRRLEMQLRHRDVEQWMRYRRLPDLLRRQVRQSDRFAWSATRGVNEEALLENLPEDLQIEIRRHLFNFIKRIRIFSVVDDPIFDAICQKLRQKTYIKGSRIIYHGGLVDKMYFIVRGKLESFGADENRASLSEGNVCGEELLTLWLENTLPIKDGRKISTDGQRLISNRTVICLTNVEAFSLKAADLEEVNTLFARFLHNPLVQGAIRYESPYWRGDAVRRIQAAWRSRNKRLNRTDKSH